MAKLDILLKVPLSHSAPMNVSGLPFYKWCPGEDEALRLKVSEGELLIWAEPSRDQELSEWLNVQVNRFVCRVLILEFKDDLVPHLRAAANAVDGATPELQEFGDRFVRELLGALNVVLKHLRARKLLYWFDVFDENTGLTHDVLQRCDATVRIDGQMPIAFRPSRRDILNGPHPGLWRSLRREDWQSIKDEISSNRRPALAGELLATALQHLANNEGRAALTEACSALELALTRFAVTKDGDGRWSTAVGDGRVPAKDLSEHVKHLGLAASVRFLVPLLFRDEELDSGILMRVNRAIELRNNVIHTGQRDIAPSEAEACVDGIIDLVGTLLPNQLAPPGERRRLDSGQ